jgi:hypothetical protein
MNIQNRQTNTPDINLSGEAVDKLVAHLNNAIIFAKSPDGSMRPFVDPMPISQIIAMALQDSVTIQNELNIKKD